jgi:hypothetical protein
MGPWSVSKWKATIRRLKQRRGQFKHFQSGPEGGLQRVTDIENHEEFHAEVQRMVKENPSLFNFDLISAPLPTDKRLRRFADDRATSFFAVDDLLSRGRDKKIALAKKHALRLVKKYLATFFSLLEKAVTGDHPNEKELRTIMDALNHPLHVVEWDKRTRKLEGYSMGVRETCGELVRYLNLIAECGPVHSVCAECGIMFMRKTGDRKYCHDCSKKHQTYQYRKEYLLKKKREYYARERAEDRHFKEKTRLQKGETKRGKKQGRNESQKSV